MAGQGAGTWGAVPALALQGVPWQAPDHLVTPARTDCREGTVLPMTTMAGDAA